VIAAEIVAQLGSIVAHAPVLRDFTVHVCGSVALATLAHSHAIGD